PKPIPPPAQRSRAPTPRKTTARIRPVELLRHLRRRGRRRSKRESSSRYGMANPVGVAGLPFIVASAYCRLGRHFTFDYTAIPPIIARGDGENVGILGILPLVRISVASFSNR